LPSIRALTIFNISSSLHNATPDCDVLPAFPLANLVVGRASGVVTPLRALLPISKPKIALTEPAPNIRVNKINVSSTVELSFIADNPQDFRSLGAI